MNEVSYPALVESDSADQSVNVVTADQNMDATHERKVTLEDRIQLLNEVVLARGGYADVIHPVSPLEMKVDENGKFLPPTAEEVEAWQAGETSRQQERIDTAEREREYFLKLVLTGRKIAEGNEGKVVMLFDVDQTASEMDPRNGKRVFRPAFRTAINTLKDELGPRFEAGLLTTSDAKQLQEQCFQGVDPQAVSKDFIWDTRAYMKASGMVEYTRDDRDGKVYADYRRALAESPEKLEGILHPDIYAAIMNKTLPIEAIGSGGKLNVLANLHATHKNIRFIHVDDCYRALYDRQRVVFEELLARAEPRVSASKLGL